MFKHYKLLFEVVAKFYNLVKRKNKKNWGRTYKVHLKRAGGDALQNLEMLLQITG
jgi:hypothetical protein